LNRNPERSSPGYCFGCGDRAHAHDSLLPCGIEQTGHDWLHSRCWPAWYAARKAKAASALAAMGIMVPVIHSVEQKRHGEHPPSDATRESRTANNQIAFQRQMNGGWSMSNIISGRQLRAARTLARITQKQLAQEVGVHERAARYWELIAHKDRSRVARSCGYRICNTDRGCAACHRRCRRLELTGRPHEKVNCLQTAMSNQQNQGDDGQQKARSVTQV
jgi:hypothetical protein